MKKLKPCPFCGGEAEIFKGKMGDGSLWLYPSCVECESMAETIEKWNKRKEVSLPTKEKILEALMDSNFYKKVGLHYSPEDFSRDVKELVNDLHALLMSRNVKEPQGPKKVYTYKSLPSRKDYRTGFNAAIDLCKQALQDAQGKQ